MRTRSALAVLALALAVALAGCAPDGPRRVTAEEAELLAGIGPANAASGTRGLTASLVSAGAALELTADLDFRTGTGLGVLVVEGEPESDVLWNAEQVAFRPATGDGVPEPPDSLDGWEVRALDPADGALPALLAVLSSLGDPSPPDPAVYLDGGSLRIGERTLDDGTATTVFTAPAEGAVGPDGLDAEAASARYWLDADGLLRRLEVRLGAVGTVVDFDPRSG